MFRWTYFTRWQGGPFPAYLRKTDRLPQAESLGIAYFSRLACVSVSLYLCQVSTLSSQRLLQNFFFLICAELIPVLFLFLRYRGDGKCRDKNGKQKRRKDIPAVSASYDPSCVRSIVQFWWPPVFGRRILTYFGFLVRAKSC